MRKLKFTCREMREKLMNGDYFEFDEVSDGFVKPHYLTKRDVEVLTRIGILQANKGVYLNVTRKSHVEAVKKSLSHVRQAFFKWLVASG